MSDERNPQPGYDRAGMWTFSYDCGQGMCATRTTRYDFRGRAIRDDGTVAPSESGTCGPCVVLTHAFEFRLAGSETQERRLALVNLRLDELVVAITAVRAYVTRHGEGVSGTSPIGGVEVRATLDQRGIVCTASVSDFAGGDLVVVQVDVAVFG
jgi:hypothetical protein